jgi:hypothetical protein
VTRPLAAPRRHVGTSPYAISPTFIATTSPPPIFSTATDFICSLDEGLRVTQRLRNVYHDCARPE